MSASADSVSPFDDVRALANKPVEPDVAAGEAVAHQLRKFGREGDFGQLGEAAEWLARWQRRYPPRIENALLVMFAGSHGLLQQGVSLSSDDNTRSFVDALKTGRAPLSAIASQAGVNIQVMELALDVPTANIADAPAMSERDCAATIAYGFEALANKPDCLAIGVSGAGIGTAAAAVAFALYGGSADYWVRPSQGVPAEMTKLRAALVEKAVQCHRGRISDPLGALAALGGRELAASVGAILAARLQSVPVILDGFATTIAAGVVHALNPKAVSHVIAAHATRRPAHEAALERVDLKPLLDLEFQTGGGLGAATAVGLLRTACAPFIAEPSGRE
ncbi:MAG: nicotinate-nucleotide--dimethylbenzimidazole phosphoribosyltransferase [Pseudomonadota bacterium]